MLLKARSEYQLSDEQQKYGHTQQAAVSSMYSWRHSQRHAKLSFQQDNSREWALPLAYTNHQDSVDVEQRFVDSRRTVDSDRWQQLLRTRDLRVRRVQQEPNLDLKSNPESWSSNNPMTSSMIDRNSTSEQLSKQCFRVQNKIGMSEATEADRHLRDCRYTLAGRRVSR